MSDSKRSVNDRIADLESALAHQQHAFDSLNEVVIEQANTIDLLQRRAKNLEGVLDELRQSVPGEGDRLVDEKPPHY